MTTRNLLSAFVDTPWAILPAKLAVLEDIVLRHVNGEKLDPEEVQSRIHGAMRPAQRLAEDPHAQEAGLVSKKVAVLPLFGSIFPRANLMTEVSGATSTEMFGKQFDALVNDPSIDAIVLDVDSPGGQVGGVQELADKIYEARGNKPIVAVANHTMASAAYWIASAVDKVYASPSADIGSIGVFAVHQDVSQALENDGVKVSIIKAGKYKAEGNPYQPLTEEAQANMQASVDEVYGKFVEAVARNRGVSVDVVKTSYGEGRVLSADQAVAIGMADEIATLDDVIHSFFNGSQATAQPENLSEAETQAVSARGQVPAAEISANDEAQARRMALVEAVAHAQARDFGDPMSENIRKMMGAHADAVRNAQALVEVAEEEDRDLTEEELAKVDGFLTQAEDLSGKIKARQDLRQRLEAQVNKVGGAVSAEAEKPEANNAAKNVLTRAEFDALPSTQKAEFSRAGGKISD